MSFTDALSRISQIQQQMTALSDGSLLSGSATSSSAASSATDDGSTTSDSSASSFADALSQASDGSDASGSGTMLDDMLSAASEPSSTTGGLSSSLTGGASLTGTTSTSSSLPASASSMLTSDQQQFASTLVADTGLNPSVVTSWLLAEESGGAAQSRQTQDNNDWLNIGYTDSGTDGSGDSIWSDPVAAANATAGWLKGQDTIPGYGTASSGIQSILQSVGQTPSAQISALQNSGWASSGYPDLNSLYSQVVSS